MNFNQCEVHENEWIEAMPPLKQPVSLRDLAMDVIITFFSNYCDKFSTEGSLDKLRQGISFMKENISPHIPWQISADFHEKFLHKWFFLPDFEPIERPEIHKKAMLEIIMDRKIVGLRCMHRILAPLDSEDVHRIQGLKELDLCFFLYRAVPYSIENFHLEDLTKLYFEYTCTDKDLEIIGRNCRKLEYLSISISGEVTDVGLRCLIPCSELRYICLFECFQVTHNGIYELLSAQGKIQKVISWDHESIAKNLRVHPSVNSLSIGTSINRISSKYLRAVAVRFPNLASLTISGFVKGDFRILKSLSKLSKLDLSSVSNLNWDKFEELLTFIGSNISDIRLGCIRSWTAGMTQNKLNIIFKYCSNIQHLELHRVPGRRREKQVLVIPNFPKLKVLMCIIEPGCYNYHVDLECNERPSLETLELYGVHVTNEEMESMILDNLKFPNLKVVITDRVPAGDFDYNGIPNEVPSNYDINRMQKIVRDNNIDLDIMDLTNQ